jgi:protein TonB
LNRILITSAIIHVVLILVLPFIPMLTRSYDLGYDVYAVELIDLPVEAPAVQEEAPVEEVEEIEEPEPEPEPEEEVVEEEPPVEIPEKPPTRVAPPAPEKRPSLEERLAERLKQQEDTKPERQPEKPAQQMRAPSTQALVKASRFPYSWYLSIVQGKVSSNWKQPSARLLGGETLRTTVSFRIRRSGSIEAVTVRKSSGRPTVDQSAAKAVRDSAPFPPLPDDFRDSFLDVTIDFTIAPE